MLRPLQQTQVTDPVGQFQFGDLTHQVGKGERQLWVASLEGGDVGGRSAGLSRQNAYLVVKAFQHRRPRVVHEARFWVGLTLGLPREYPDYPERGRASEQPSADR